LVRLLILKGKSLVTNSRIFNIVSLWVAKTPSRGKQTQSIDTERDVCIGVSARRYRQLYGGRLIAENGKIKLLREFCDTVEVARAMFPNGVKDLVQKD